MKNRHQTMDYDWIDLMDCGRIVVNPIEIQETGEQEKGGVNGVS